MCGFPAPSESAIVPFLINRPAIVFYFVLCLLGDSSQVASWPSADRHKDTSTSCDKATRPRRLASVVRLIVPFFTYLWLRLWKVRQSSERWSQKHFAVQRPVAVRVCRRGVGRHATSHVDILFLTSQSREVLLEAM